jgi:plasmid maintenance system antidote protein VapI
MTDFREMVRQGLQEKKWSIPKLARKVELNEQTIYNFLQGKTAITADNLQRILDILATE